MFYPGIQALRGIAAIMVVIQHSIVLTCFAFGADFTKYAIVDLGYYGVLAFFCISGFVIGLTRQMALGEFVLRRLLRVYPPYWVACAMVMIATGQSMTMQAALLLPTSHLIAFSLPYWTLIYEIFFYVFAAALIGARISDRWLVAIMAGWIISTHTFSPLFATADVAAPGWRLPLSHYNQFFCAGFICAIFLTRLRRVPAITIILAAVIGIVCHEYLAYSLTWRALSLSVTMTAIILIAARLRRIPATLLHLGEASYGIYLIHFVTIGLTIQWLKSSVGLAATIAACVVSSVIAGVAFGLIESKVYKRITRSIWQRHHPEHLQQAKNSPAPSPVAGST